MAHLVGSNGLVKKTTPVVFKHSVTIDGQRRYLTDSPTPNRIAQFMKDADSGDVGAMIEITEEMEGKDSHLQAVSARRREALTALEWEIVPETRTDEPKKAQAAADYAMDELLRIPTWEDTLDHLATGIAPGVAVTELVWKEGRLQRTIDIPGHRLLTRPWIDNTFRIETEEEQVDGEPIYGVGYILHTPNSRAGFPLRVTLTRAAALLWLLKHFGVADWSVFSEQYGTPWRVAMLKDGATDDDVANAESMVRDMASDTWGVFTDAVDFKFLEAARTNQPYEGMIDWIENKMSILFLGQTLTTEQGTVGSLALGRVHENVRASITLSDIKQEASTIRQQVLAPMVKFWRPREVFPVPHFRRKVVEDKNLDERRVRLDELRFAKELNLPIDTDVLYEQLNIPQPRNTPDAQP